MQVVLQPCGSSAAREHFVDTIQNPVPVERLEAYITADQAQLIRDTFGEIVPVWGVTPAKNDSSAKQWQRMAIGDVILLYKDKRFFMQGTIAYKFRNEPLAEALWRRHPDGSTWEYMFLLSGLREIEIDVGVINRAAGFKPNFVVQRFLLLDGERSTNVLDALDVDVTSGAIAVTATDRERAIQALQDMNDDLDEDVRSRRRREQELLREIVLGGRPEGSCAICGSELPVTLLVVGHIKPRSSCPADERKTLANVMPVCTLGCDSLFERGFILVNSLGQIERNTRKRGTDDLEARANEIVGRDCIAWSASAARFFEWHREHHSRLI